MERDHDAGRPRPFPAPGFAVFVDLACGWVPTPGRRTVTRIIGVIDPEGRRAHDAYHRWLRDGVWQMDQLWRSLTVVIVARCVAPDAAVIVDLDDTVFQQDRPAHRRSGKLP